MKLRTVAAALSLIDGIWSIALGAFWNHIFGIGSGDISCLGPCYPGNTPYIVLAVGVVLLIDSLLCFLAFSRAFYISAILSILAVALVLALTAGLSMAWASHLGIPATIILGIATAVLDVVAATRKTYVSDEHHPLNLPVFG